MDLKSTRIWGKTLEIAENWFRRFCTEGGGEKIPNRLCLMRAEIIAYMIYSKGPEYPEYVMHFFYLKYSGTPKYRNMLGKFLSKSALLSKRKLPKVFGAPRIQEYVMHILSA